MWRNNADALIFHASFVPAQGTNVPKAAGGRKAGYEKT